MAEQREKWIQWVALHRATGEAQRYEAVMLLQIAMWYVGLLFGVGGLGCMANGMWGWF